MKTIKTFVCVAGALTLGTAVSQGNILGKAVEGTAGAVSSVGKGAIGAVSNPVGAVKNVGGTAVSGVKGLASLPGKAFSSLGSNELPDLSAGTQEFGIAGNVGFRDEFSYNLDLSYGYFFKDNWQVGFNAGLIGREDNFSLSVGLFTEYNWDLGSKWVPYIGGGIGLAGVSLEDGSGDFDNEFSLDVAGEFGVKYFLRSNFAISFGVDFSWTPADALDAEIGGDINIGTRFYF